MCQKVHLSQGFLIYEVYIYVQRVWPCSCAGGTKICVRVRVYIRSAKEAIRWDTKHFNLKSIRPRQPPLEGRNRFGTNVYVCVCVLNMQRRNVFFPNWIKFCFVKAFWISRWLHNFSSSTGSWNYIFNLICFVEVFLGYSHAFFVRISCEDSRITLVHCNKIATTATRQTDRQSGWTLLECCPKTSAQSNENYNRKSIQKRFLKSGTTYDTASWHMRDEGRGSTAAVCIAESLSVQYCHQHRANTSDSPITHNN